MDLYKLVKAGEGWLIDLDIYLLQVEENRTPINYRVFVTELYIELFFLNRVSYELLLRSIRQNFNCRDRENQ